jgi:hypothetical protein
MDPSLDQTTTEPTDIASLTVEKSREIVDSTREMTESLQDSPQKAGSVSNTPGSGPAKQKKELSPAQLQHLEKMRESRAAKKQQPKVEPIIKMSQKEEFLLWQKKQLMKKDSSWKKMLDSRIDAFEQSFTDRIQQRLYEILEAPLDEFYQNSKKHRKRKEPEADEEAPQTSQASQSSQAQHVAPSKRNYFAHCF